MVILVVKVYEMREVDFLVGSNLVKGEFCVIL